MLVPFILTKPVLSWHLYLQHLIKFLSSSLASYLSCCSLLCPCFNHTGFLVLVLFFSHVTLSYMVFLLIVMFSCSSFHLYCSYFFFPDMHLCHDKQRPPCDQIKWKLFCPHHDLLEIFNKICNFIKLLYLFFWKKIYTLFSSCLMGHFSWLLFLVLSLPQNLFAGIF